MNLNFIVISPCPNPFTKGVHSMKQKVGLTVLQKQIRKCNEIVILQKSQVSLQTDILEQA